jgi:hypothetical protein
MPQLANLTAQADANAKQCPTTDKSWPTAKPVCSPTNQYKGETGYPQEESRDRRGQGGAPAKVCLERFKKHPKNIENAKVESCQKTTPHYHPTIEKTVFVSLAHLTSLIRPSQQAWRL